jgi:hypothetical protein
MEMARRLIRTSESPLSSREVKAGGWRCFKEYIDEEDK